MVLGRLSILALGLSAFLAAVPASAAGLLPLPELSSGFNLTTYAGSTDMVHKDFPEIAGVSFEIALPKTWTERIAISQDFGEIARFDGPAYGDVRPYFSFKRLQVHHEISGQMQLMTYLLKQGSVLRSLKQLDDRNIEALYVNIDSNGDSYVVRAMGRIMGPTMLLAEYALPVAVWDQLRDEQTFAMRSFKFLKDSAEPIETRIERTYFKALKFFYPQSWTFTKEVVPADNMVTVRLATKGETGLEAGRINLSVFAQKSLKNDADLRKYPVDVPETLKTLRKQYEDSGYIIGKTIEHKKPDLNLPVTFSALDIYEVERRTTMYETDKKQPVTHELWIAVFQTKGLLPKTYVVEMFTPARMQDLYQWAINTRAFEIILKSIQ